MGLLLSRTSVQELELPACMISQVYDDHLIYFPNHILYFDESLKNECLRILDIVISNNRVVKIYYSAMIIYGIGIAGCNFVKISPKLVPTTFGCDLQDRR
jgi:hypothetical protein